MEDFVNEKVGLSISGLIHLAEQKAIILSGKNKPGPLPYINKQSGSTYAKHQRSKRISKVF